MTSSSGHVTRNWHSNTPGPVADSPNVHSVVPVVHLRCLHGATSVAATAGAVSLATRFRTKGLSPQWLFTHPPGAGRCYAVPRASPPPTRLPPRSRSVVAVVMFVAVVAPVVPTRPLSSLHGAAGVSAADAVAGAHTSLARAVVVAVAWVVVSLTVCLPAWVMFL